MKQTHIKLGTQKNGKKISWRILKKYKDNIALVISENILFYHCFDNSNNNQYSTSTIRQYLNHMFIGEYFNNDEQQRIVTVRMDLDKVFLLDQLQITKYLPNQESRKLNSRYWLADGSEKDTRHAYFVHLDGNIYDVGFVDSKYGIRPAMYISLE